MTDLGLLGRSLVNKNRACKLGCAIAPRQVCNRNTCVGSCLTTRQQQRATAMIDHAVAWQTCLEASPPTYMRGPCIGCSTSEGWADRRRKFEKRGSESEAATQNVGCIMTVEEKRRPDFGLDICAGCEDRFSQFLHSGVRNKFKAARRSKAEGNEIHWWRRGPIL